MPNWLPVPGIRSTDYHWASTSARTYRQSDRFTLTSVHKRIPTLVVSEENLLTVSVSNPVAIQPNALFILGTRLLEVAQLTQRVESKSLHIGTTVSNTIYPTSRCV